MMLCHYRDYDFKAQDGQRHIIIAIMYALEILLDPTVNCFINVFELS